MTIPIRRIHQLTPQVYEGAVGTFQGESLSQPNVKYYAQGVIVKIVDGPQWALVHVRTQSGTIVLKMP